MTCAASTSEMIGVELSAGDLRGCFEPGCCASTIADVIAQISRVALSITIYVQKGRPQLMLLLSNERAVQWARSRAAVTIRAMCRRNKKERAVSGGITDVSRELRNCPIVVSDDHGVCRIERGHHRNRPDSAATADFVGNCNCGNSYARLERHERRWFVRETSQQRILLHATSA